MGSDMSEGIFTVRCEIQKFENWETNQQKICLTGVERGRTEIGGLWEWDELGIGIGDWDWDWGLGLGNGIGD